MEEYNIYYSNGLVLSSPPPWYSDREMIRSVVIENEVSSISDSAFYDCMNLLNVTIGNHVDTIGRQAFIYCRRINKCTIPDSVIRIYDSAFSGCTALESVSLSNNLDVIGNYAFSDCHSLETVVIPASVSSIGKWSFGTGANNNTLKSIVFLGDIDVIAEEAFRGNSYLQSVTIKSVNKIDTNAFGSCNRPANKSQGVISHFF